MAPVATDSGAMRERGGGSSATPSGSVRLLFIGQDLVVDARRLLLVERARDDVEPGRDTVRRHRRQRQCEVARCLRVLPLRGVNPAVQHLLRRIQGVAPTDDGYLARLDADLVE